ncbi:GNAT family N-acetyltransferase [Kitasatospora sp. RB6PN24]|uniref:GNAT family N-acetyltransferase n=1 Tax=Kitasatospora humi TaxID=2893891 RepID=UPI001E4C2F2B|nr:GNAT family N-acetyltransferase [Kitasatospora humi]MCC9309570.1 GNAT family N-acetyltransferase [Kitasatospora humi]
MLLGIEMDGRCLRIRDLEPPDEQGVFSLFEACEDWFCHALGQPAMPGDVQSLYYSLPEGAEFENKAILVIEAEGRISGLIDAVREHPHPGACSVGLFLMHPDCRRFGLGRAVASALIGSLAAGGCTEVLASVAEGWRPGLKFLDALGFVAEAPHEAGPANRNPGPGERPTVRARLRISAISCPEP